MDITSKPPGTIEWEWLLAIAQRKAERYVSNGNGECDRYHCYLINAWLNVWTLGLSFLLLQFVILTILLRATGSIKLLQNEDWRVVSSRNNWYMVFQSQESRKMIFLYFWIKTVVINSEYMAISSHLILSMYQINTKEDCANTYQLLFNDFWGIFLYLPNRSLGITF